jgi:hypothetical protein
MVDPRGVRKTCDDYKRLSEEQLPVVIESSGSDDNVHERIRAALKELGITDGHVLTRIVDKLGSPGSPLLNIGQCAPDTKVEAGIRDEVLHLRAVHSWWFNVATGDDLHFEGGL